jgi:hypothetical protein
VRRSSAKLGSFVSLTFVDGIVTEFADIGRVPDDDIFAGR